MLSVKAKVCQRCGTAFSCGTGGRDGGCWCMDEPAKLPLPTDGSDCLCPTCLALKRDAYRAMLNPSTGRDRN